MNRKERKEHKDRPGATASSCKVPSLRSFAVKIFEKPVARIQTGATDLPEPDEPSRNQIAKPEEDKRGLGKIARLTSFPRPLRPPARALFYSAGHLTRA
jgi:hypothetical protein